MQNIQLTGHNVEITPALREFAISKFSRVERHAERITSFHVVFNVDKLRQMAEATLALPGTQIHASAESENMYKTIDALVDKLIRQISKHKDKQSDHSS